jgi:hypothetical protein
MAWNPAIPATNADLLSAPVRDNFNALDTALMAALATLANGSVLTKTAGPVIAGISAVATGAVLASAGVNTAPTWNTAPSLTSLMLSGLTQGSVLFAGSGGLVSQDNANLFFDDTNNNLRLFGGAVGTSGQKVLALGAGTLPTTSPVDTVQLMTTDMYAEAGSRALRIRDERGGTVDIGSDSSANGISITSPGGGPNLYLYAQTNALVGTGTNHPLSLLVNAATRMSFGTDFHTSLTVAGVATARLLGTGAADSGGAGWRTLLIAN